MLSRSLNVEAKTLDSHCLSVSNHVVATDLEDRNVKIKVPVLIKLKGTINPQAGLRAIIGYSLNKQACLPVFILLLG